MHQVEAATRAVETYKDVVYAVAPFNEPDNKFWRAGTPLNAFMTHPALPKGSYDDKVNWLWTQTVRKIRTIDPALKIMGPNYEGYRPWDEKTGNKNQMPAFLQNAVATNTVPDTIAWHSLGPSPGDVPAALTSSYRPLEESLKVPGRPLPVAVEEYGPATGDFEGVPGSMIKHWAEMERDGVDFAAMGIYANGGLLGNTLRYASSPDLKPNGGWFMMYWYSQMQGQYAPVSRWDTRRYQSFDGVASWDAPTKTATLLLGGADESADVQVSGVRAAGLGPSGRVRLECTVWDVDPNQADRAPEHGGDPKTGTYSVYDKTMTVSADGTLNIPVHRLEGYNGYRVLISPVAKPGICPTKYEAEAARLTHAVVRRGADAAPLASGNAYVGGLDFPDSAAQFMVTAPAAGVYLMTVRYADGTPQGRVTYQPTNGWSNSEMRTTTKRIALNAGRNTVALAHATGSAEIDYIDVRPDAHRYEAEFAHIQNAEPDKFAHEINVPNYVGGLDTPYSYVEFAVDAPRAGAYTLTIGYANGTTSVSHLALTVGGSPAQPVPFAPTSGWFSAPDPNRFERTVAVPCTLTEGVNTVRLRKADGFAEMDYLTLGLR